MTTKRDNPDTPYQVGYRKPPLHSQFRKGQSGNARGRPKGALNVKTVLVNALKEKVAVIINGRRVVMTKLEAAIKQLVNKAATGDSRALAQLLAITSGVEEAGAAATELQLDERDIKVMRRVIERNQYLLKGLDSDRNSNG